MEGRLLGSIDVCVVSIQITLPLSHTQSHSHSQSPSSSNGFALATSRLGRQWCHARRGFGNFAQPFRSSAVGVFIARLRKAWRKYFAARPIKIILSRFSFALRIVGCDVRLRNVVFSTVVCNVGTSLRRSCKVFQHKGRAGWSDVYWLGREAPAKHASFNLVLPGISGRA